MADLRVRATRMWRSDSRVAAAARVALLPAAGMFRAAVAVRNALYDSGALRAHEPPLATVSIGNLSTGGAGKTPFAAWLACELQSRGAAPAIVMRGYGGDEPLVHRELNPEIPVFVGGDRLTGIEAAGRAGCDTVVLDDAFQHRRVARDEDVVLVSADAWAGSLAVLPAGPWREPLSALRRATLGIITVKAEPRGTVDELRDGLGAVAPSVPLAVARLDPATLRGLLGPVHEPLSALRGQRVLAVAAVADPQPFFRQLEMLGATVTARTFADHHRYGVRDALALRKAAERHDKVVCTLKDAVKLRQHWSPDATPAWYVSQSVRIEHGAAEVAALVHRLLMARTRRQPGIAQTQ